ncbi:transcriptional regulator [Geodermatophilus sp. SYSU D00703]
MDNRSDIRDFLASRRARITPEQAGLLPGRGRRWVPGLRREEVAVLAGVSEDVLEAVGRALQLDDAERHHLSNPARAAEPTRTSRRRRRVRVRPRVQWLLDSMSSSAAIALDGRMDVLAANTLGRALYSPVFADPRRPANIARCQFLDPRARDFHPDWDGAASTTVALLRTEAGRDPEDRDLRELVGELSTVGEEFRTRWATHDVRIHRTGVEQFRHPAVGTLDLVHHSTALPTEGPEDLHLTVCTAEPGTASEDALKLLASWTATTTQQVRATAAGMS